MGGLSKPPALTSINPPGCLTGGSLADTRGCAPAPSEPPALREKGVRTVPRHPWRCVCCAEPEDHHAGAEMTV